MFSLKIVLNMYKCDFFSSDVTELGFTKHWYIKSKDIQDIYLFIGN